MRKNFRPAYDILVRPRNSFTPLEKKEKLVKANYLSGIFGGISMKQYRQIKNIPGVEVAAPIENLGYVLLQVPIPIRINGVLNKNPVQIYRLKGVWKADRGLSTYPENLTTYVYYTRKDPLVSMGSSSPGAPLARQAPSQGDPYEVVPGKKNPLPVCTTLEKAESGGSPFGYMPDSPFAHVPPSINCFSALSPKDGTRYFGPTEPAGTVGIIDDLSAPILLAAIDPKEESKLVGLKKTVVNGSYLKEDAAFKKVIYDKQFGDKARQVPVLASTKTFVDDILSERVERLNIPGGTNVPEILSNQHRVRGFLSGLSGRVVESKEVKPGPVYHKLLEALRTKRGASLINSREIDAYWSSSPVRYEQEGGKRLRVLTTTNPPFSTWNVPLYGGVFPAPMDNADTQFRRLKLHAGNNNVIGGLYETATVKVVGEFDPEKLPGFSSLSKVPLETYYPPVAMPADAKSKKLLHNKPLLPSMNLGGYLSQPPLMLTTLKAAKAFTNPVSYTHTDYKKHISVIRVRVKGVKGPDPLSREKIRRVAQAIVKETHLRVDVTAGSSPTTVTIDLPKGKFGRPPLVLKEGWVKKGASVEILRGIDKKSATLFALILVVCAFFLSNGAFASVRARRKEFGILLSLGWSRGRVLAVVLEELALIGLVAGIVGAAIAAGMVEAFSLKLPLLRTLLVVPLSMLLAVLSGLIPALRAARGKPMDAILPPVKPPRSSSGRVRTIFGMAMRNLTRLPARTALGVGGLVIGVGALSVLFGIDLSFYTLASGTALGDFLTTQVRPVDYLSVALAIALGGLSVADVLFLNLKERAPESVTLRSCGWEERHLRLLALFEGLGMGLIGSLAGAILGFIALFVLTGLNAEIVGLTLLAAMGGVVVALVASVVPAVVLSRLAAPEVLAEE